MNYKKIKKNNYNLHLINNKRFKTINVDLCFTQKFKKENTAYMNLLVKLLAYTTKKYNTKNKLSIKCEDLYSTSITTRYAVIGNAQVLIVSLDFINPCYTEESMYEDSFSLLKEVIFNPNTLDNHFNEETFELNKRNIMREVRISKEKPNVIAYENYAKEMYNGSSKYSILGNVKDYENITSKEIYDFYKNIINNSKIDILVMGETNENKIIELTDKLLKNIDPKYNNIESLYIKEKIKENTLYKKDSLKFNQSILLMGYKFNDITDYEIKHVMPLLNVILGSMNNSILFTKVREENSYCYSVSSSISRYNTSITVSAGINKKNYDKVVNKVKECINILTNEKEIDKLLTTAVKTINTYLNDYYDNVYSVIEHYYISEFDTVCDVEEVREIVKKITSKDIASLATKMKLDTVYLMEGILE